MEKILSYSWCQKIVKIVHLVKKVCKLKYCKLKQFQELTGNLQHALFGITGGKGIFSPIYQAMKKIEDYVKITPYQVS